MMGARVAFVRAALLLSLALALGGSQVQASGGAHHNRRGPDVHSIEASRLGCVLMADEHH